MPIPKMQRLRYGLQREGAAALLRGARSEGGASPRVKENSDKAEAKATEQNVPWLLAKMYAASPIINTDQSRAESVGMVERTYIPVTPIAEEKSRPASEKFKNWFFKGVWK